jgi:hypothetical protein
VCGASCCFQLSISPSFLVFSMIDVPRAGQASSVPHTLPVPNGTWSFTVRRLLARGALPYVSGRAEEVFYRLRKAGVIAQFPNRPQSKKAWHKVKATENGEA